MTVRAANRGTVANLPVALEEELLTKVRNLAKGRGVLCYHTHDSRRSEGGFPDVTLVGPGGIAFLELKRAKGGRVTPKQRMWIAALQAADQIAEVVKPKDLPYITRLIRFLSEPSRCTCIPRTSADPRAPRQAHGPTCPALERPERTPE